MAERNLKGDVNVEFTEATSRQGLDSGESVKTLFGKIRKWLSDLKAVAFSGSYNDLSNKPTIPTVNNGTLTIQKNGTNVATFTANQSGNSTANITVPTKVSQLTNDSGYTTNTGTVTQVKVGSTAYNPSSGVISLPAYPTKSSLGLGNVDNTSDANKPISTAQQTALNGKVSKAGDTMTGELKTSFNCVANGSIAIESKVGGFPVTLPNFIDVIRKSSGCSGSAYFSAYTFNDITTPEGWYNFEWIPHRTGGSNGATSGDNCNYGALILTGMTVENKGYIVKYSGLKITEVHELYKGEELEAQVNYNTNQGVKNLVKITADTRTISGVTFTVDKVAGTVTANGTSTSQIAFKLTDYLSTSILQVGNTYILSGCPAGGNYTSTYALYVFKESTGSTVWADVGLSGGSSYVIPSDIRLSPLYILIRPGVTVSNIVFKPMIRYASIKDNTFELYAEPNYQLTQKVDKALDQTGYNMLEITANTQTINGITFTVDKAAGTITANGTATAQVAFVINSNVGLSLNYKGELWSDGSPSGSSVNTYFLNYEDYNGKNVNCYTNEPILLTNTTPPATITRVLIYIRSGVTVNNLVFKPMITTAELAGMPFQPYSMNNVKLTQKALIKEDDNAGGYVVYFDKDCKLQRNSNYIYLRNNSINIHTDSSNIGLQCGTTGSPLRGVQITNTAVRMYFGLNTLTVDEDGLWFNNTKIAE